jgi:META domain
MKTLFSVLCLACFVATACQKTDVSTTTSTELSKAQNITTSRMATENIAGEWAFKGYLNAKISSTAQATLNIAKDGTNSYILSGRSFVNLYNWTFKIDETAGLVIGKGNGISSLMAAMDEKMMQDETNYLNNLGLSKKFAIENNTLKIYLNNPATEIMYFEKK